ncbi:purine-nucleoside phosphorylase [Acidobacteriota bacterium]
MNWLTIPSGLNNMNISVSGWRQELYGFFFENSKMMIEKERLSEAVDFLKEKIKNDVTVAVILGSGLGAFANRLDEKVEISYEDIPYFPASQVEGHRGVLAAGWIRERRILAFSGRFHLYQGYGPGEVVLPVLVARRLGAAVLIVTCSAGGVDKKLEAGDTFFIVDQINLMGVDPITEIPEEKREPRFLDMTGAYDQEILDKNSELASMMGLSYRRGVLAGLRGPSYETRAEVRWLRNIGAHAVGMSVIPEVIFARYMGMKVAGVALITNRASDEESIGPAHEDVLDVAQRHGEEFADLLERIIDNLPQGGSQ